MARRILVSACLLGQPVRYDARAKTLGHRLLDAWRAAGVLVPLCPEVAAGFPTPRAPAEITPGLGGAEVLAGTADVVEDAGTNVTAGFVAGAQIAVDTAQRFGCRFALLTDGSPSCGSTFLYSGHHDGVTRPGLGVVTAALRQAGVSVFAPHQIGDLQAQFAAAAPASNPKVP